MESLQKKILLLGLPEVGKTSFLAALMHYVASPLEGKSLSQYQLSTNTTYITAIVQDWLKGKKQERTKITATKNSNTTAEIYLEKLPEGQKFTLHIPDFFGEVFENQFFYRDIELEYLDQIKESSGIILFLHPSKIKQPVLIEDVQIARIVAELIDNESPESGSTDNVQIDEVATNEVISAIVQSDTAPPQQEESIELAKEFKVEDSPTQIVIVDLLEAHLEYLSSLPIQLSLVISAWDIVKADREDMSPMKWIETSMPLLYQYLISNTERISFKGFGVSAQGGDIENPAIREQLLSNDEPADRIIVQDGENVHKNIASPIEWILEQWQKTGT